MGLFELELKSRPRPALGLKLFANCDVGVKLEFVFAADAVVGVELPLVAAIALVEPVAPATPTAAFESDSVLTLPKAFKTAFLAKLRALMEALTFEKAAFKSNLSSDQLMA